MMLRERRVGPLEASREATPSSREPLAKGEQDSESCSATTVSVTPTSVCGRKNPAPHHIVPSPASGLQEREEESVSCTVTSRGGSAHTVQSDPLSTSTQLRQREQRLCAGKARVRSGQVTAQGAVRRSTWGGRRTSEMLTLLHSRGCRLTLRHLRHTRDTRQSSAVSRWEKTSTSALSSLSGREEGTGHDLT